MLPVLPLFPALAVRRLRSLGLLSATLLGAASAVALDLAVEVRTKTITVLTDKPSEVVRYTLNGKDPDFNAGVYLAPITLPQGGTVKAAVFEGNKMVGPVVTRSLPVSSSDVINTAELPLTQNRDWKTYDWVQRHQEVLALNKGPAAKAQVVMLGDSITHFWGGEPKSARVNGQASWDKYLAPRQAINLGFGWDRTENVLWRLRHGEIAGLKPKAFVVLIGTNNLMVNTVPETVDGVEEVVLEIRRQAPEAKVLLLALLPRSERPDALRQKVVDANALLKDKAAKLGVTCLDLSPKFLLTDGRIPKALMNDFLHPTERGYEIIGSALDEVLKSWNL